MAKKKQQNLQNIDTFSAGDLERIQELAFHSVFEPFEINLALKVIRETRVKIEEKISPIFQKTSLLKSKVRGITGSIKSIASKNGSRLLEWGEKKNIEKPEAFNHLKEHYDHLGEKFKNHFFIQLDKGLSLVFEREFEKLVIKKAKTILGLELENIVAIQRLPRTDKMKLLESMYPFELNFTGKLRKTVNQTSNILLGALVASNIPLTGATVNIITTFKTIIYLSNRLHLLASIYGHPIICKEAMFVVATKIISSIVDYENNAKHKPLNPKVIGELYQYTMNSSLFELLKKSTIKDLYISVPLVGSLSLAKITLDEQSVTKLTLQLVKDYFEYQELKEKYGESKLKQELDIWRRIYFAQKKCGWVDKVIKEAATEKGDSQNLLKKIIKKVKSFEVREQIILQKIHLMAKKIYKLRNNSGEKLESLVEKICK
jgi:hypothetical protein